MSPDEKLRHAMISSATFLAKIDQMTSKADGLKTKEMNKLVRDVAKLTREEANLMDGFAADPDLRQHMRCWMFDFEGKESMNEEILLKHPNDWTPDEVKRSSEARFGYLPIIVRDWLEGREFNITDSGSGAHGWHLGVHCDDAELESLSKLARVIFAEQLTSGELTVSLKFWGWHFRGIDDAAEWLKQNALV